MPDPVRYSAQHPLAFITLNRPQRLNAINRDLTRALQDAVASANRDPNVRVIVLRGAGPAFCAGYDLEAAPAAEATAQERTGGWDPVVDFRGMSENVRAFIIFFSSVKKI